MAGTVLVVDDDPVIQELLGLHLQSVGYQAASADDGEQAWRMLTESPIGYSAVLLDIMMPGMDGYEVLSRMKADRALKFVPVIFQSAKVERNDVLRGLREGAFHYLTKPIDKSTLLAVVKTATRDYANHRDLVEELDQTAATLSLLESGSFRFRTLEEAYRLATLLAKGCPDPERAVIGLSELMVNAIEHGNLGVTYEEKSSLTDRLEWEEEIRRRLAQLENQSKVAQVEFQRKESGFEFVVTDMGEGFDWRPYLEISMDRLLDTHGRGILLAKTTSFDRLEYRGCGNQVVATIMSPR